MFTRTERWRCDCKTLVVEIRGSQPNTHINLNDELTSSIWTIEGIIERKIVVIKDCLLADVGLEAGDIEYGFKYSAYSETGTPFSKLDVTYLATYILFDLLKQFNYHDKEYVAKIENLRNEYINSLE